MSERNVTDGIASRPADQANAVGEPAGPIELSVVMPCLNEADTIASCVSKARETLVANGIAGEIVVADNGSTDDSRAIAEGLGARVVPVAARGYGNALMGGIAASRGKYVLMGDADDSYDFRELPKFLAKLREGNDLVQGCRLPSGGGEVKPGAMPFLHYWVGNPLFTQMARFMFAAPIHDVNCGLRAFTRAHYDRLDQRCTGMEFANEMIIKSSLFRARIAEVPVTLSPDGRKSHPPHLRTFRDGWRTLRFYVLYSPRWLFLIPGVCLVLAGLLGYALAMPQTRVFGAVLDVNTLLFASLAILMGYQSIVFAIFAKVFAVSERLYPDDPRLQRALRVLTLERALLLSLATFVAGLGLLGWATVEWWQVNFGNLNYEHSMRLVIPGVTLAALGFQSFMSSCFISILGLGRK